MKLLDLSPYFTFTKNSEDTIIYEDIIKLLDDHNFNYNRNTLSKSLRYNYCMYKIGKGYTGLKMKCPQK